MTSEAAEIDDFPDPEGDGSLSITKEMEEEMLQDSDTEMHSIDQG